MGTRPPEDREDQDANPGVGYFRVAMGTRPPEDREDRMRIRAGYFRVAMGTRPPEDREDQDAIRAWGTSGWQWELDPLKIERSASATPLAFVSSWQWELDPLKIESVSPVNALAKRVASGNGNSTP